MSDQNRDTTLKVIDAPSLLFSFPGVSEVVTQLQITRIEEILSHPLLRIEFGFYKWPKIFPYFCKDVLVFIDNHYKVINLK